MKISRLVPLNFLAAVSISLMLSPASAQEVEYEKVMIPVFFSEPFEIGGRFWETRFTILNSAPVPVDVYPYDDGCRLGAPCDKKLTPPGITFSPLLGLTPFLDWGNFLYVDKRYVDSVAFDLRVREVSALENWNAKIPVVRERDLKTHKVNLIGIPIHDSLRQTVRIYDFDALQNSRVVVRIFGTRPLLRLPFGQQPDPLLFEREFTFERIDRGSDATGYIQFGDFQRFVDFLPRDVRVEIESRTEGLRFWAFASINDPVTQNISIISP